MSKKMKSRKSVMAVTALFIGICVAFVTAALAQTYLDSAPKPDEQRRIAGLQYYPQSANPIWKFVQPANGETHYLTVGESNAVMYASDASALSITAKLPNVTNSVGAVFYVIAGGRTTVALGIEDGAARFLDTTNSVSSSASTWTMRTNSAVQIQAVGGTNWIVLPLKP